MSTGLQLRGPPCHEAERILLLEPPFSAFSFPCRSRSPTGGGRTGCAAADATWRAREPVNSSVGCHGLCCLSPRTTPSRQGSAAIMRPSEIPATWSAALLPAEPAARVGQRTSEPGGPRRRTPNTSWQLRDADAAWCLARHTYAYTRTTSDGRNVGNPSASIMYLYVCYMSRSLPGSSATHHRSHTTWPRTTAIIALRVVSAATSPFIAPRPQLSKPKHRSKRPHDHARYCG